MTLLQETISLLEKAGTTVQDSARKIGPGDVVIVVDMQNDFLPGGNFGVAEGDIAAETIVQLIQSAAANGAKIVATRDYHPHNHCSFNTVKGASGDAGPFPPHCVQGSDGAKFDPVIHYALTRAKETSDNVSIVFKGFSPTTDSFGAFPYQEEYGSGRLVHQGEMSCCLQFTGGYLLEASNQGKDLDAPPDILAWVANTKKPLSDVVGQPGSDTRFIVCGLAFDFCVLDTAINAVAAGYKNVEIVVDAARAAHIPGFGQFGSGFLTDPATVHELLASNSIKLVNSASLLSDLANEKIFESMEKITLGIKEAEHKSHQQKLTVVNARSPMKKLPPFGILSAVDVDITVSTMPTSEAAGTCTIKSPAVNVIFHKQDTALATLSPLSVVTLDSNARQQAAIPEAATQFAWMYPLKDIEDTWYGKTVAHFRTPEKALLVYGGFLYFDGSGQLLQTNAVTEFNDRVSTKTGSLRFEGPFTLPEECLKSLSSKERLLPVTYPELRTVCKEFAWLKVNEFESLENKLEHGGFMYTFHNSRGPIYFRCVGE